MIGQLATREPLHERLRRNRGECWECRLAPELGYLCLILWLRFTVYGDGSAHHCIAQRCSFIWRREQMQLLEIIRHMIWLSEFLQLHLRPSPEKHMHDPTALLMYFLLR